MKREGKKRTLFIYLKERFSKIEWNRDEILICKRNQKIDW